MKNQNIYNYCVQISGSGRFNTDSIIVGTHLGARHYITINYRKIANNWNNERLQNSLTSRRILWLNAIRRATRSYIL